MAIAFDAKTRFPASAGTADGTTGDRTFTHTPSGTPRGVVIIVQCNSNSAPLTGILYGGVTMTLTANAIDNSEFGVIYGYTLVTGIPSGAQTVTLQGCAVDNKFVTCNTVTAAGDTEVNGSTTTNTTTSTNPTVSVTTTKTTMSFGGVYTGFTSPSNLTIVSGSTAQDDIDYGQSSALTLRRTSPDAAGTVTMAYTGILEDWCFIGISLAEAVAAPFVARPPVMVTDIARCRAACW